jgi:hypothetical protein
MPKAANQQKSPTIERKIYFYRIDNGVNEAGVPIAFDPEPVLQVVEQLAFNTAERYLLQKDGNVLFCMAARLQAPQRIMFIQTRRNGLPPQEKDGQIKALNFAPEAGLAEITHAVFFPDDLILGAEFNYHGPSIKNLPYYLRNRLQDKCPDFSVRHLLKQNVLEDLKAVPEISLARLRIRTSHLHAVDELDADLGSAVSAAANVAGAEDIEIIVRRKKGGLAQRIQAFTRNAAQKDSIRDDVEKLTIEGKSVLSGRKEVVDILSDKYIFQSEVLLQDARSKAVRSDSAFHQIESVYSEHRDMLMAAASITS